MVENVADLMANVADLMANVADLMANVAIEKPLSYALSIGYLQETSSLLCRIHRFPREKTVVSTRETDGFRRGNRWIPVWRPMETCVGTDGDLRQSLSGSPASGPCKCRWPLREKHAERRKGEA